MDDPLSVLGLSYDATQPEIRERYLDLVRQHPPERDPDQFARIRAAYDELRDPIKSVERRIFSERRTLTFDEFAGRLKKDLRKYRLPTEFLLSLESP